MGYGGNDFSSSKKTKWGFFFIILLLSGVIFCLLVLSIHARSQTSNKHSMSRTIEGTLDHDTAQFLIHQDEFISDFYKILEADFPKQGWNQENSDSEWLKCFKLMKDRAGYMKGIDVSNAFLEYKQKVDACFSDIIYTLENMAQTGSFDADRLSNMYAGLLYFSSQRTDDLPALLDELGVEYTIGEDENGERTISYKYTDQMLTP